MNEIQPKIGGEKRRAESGLVRLFVAVCLVLLGFFIAFWVMQSVHQRMAASSLIQRLPIVFILLLLCVIVFVYARVKRGRSKGPDEQEDGRNPESS